MKWIFAGILMLCSEVSLAQLYYYPEKIYSPYTLKDDKATKRREKLIAQANSLDTLRYPEHEEDLKAALWAASQFMVRTAQSDRGIHRLCQQLTNMNSSTQRALLEVIYGLYPDMADAPMKAVLQQPASPKAFAMAALWWLRKHPQDGAMLQQQLRRQYSGWSADALLVACMEHLQQGVPQALPPMDSLFAHQRLHGFKVVYSFQRRNRDFPGLAIVQQADGRFARDSSGQLRSFVQLARAASNLPWFVQNGNTPQGLYAITGTAISRNVFIGPTPNLQMVMLGEVNPPTFTHYFPIVFNAPPERLYRSYFPESWQNWSPLMQAFQAGKIGRSEIIAHGSTIDPEWFSGQPFFPLSPTLGCLSGREWWDPKTGRISKSDQLDLVNTFIETSGTKGYLIVIELNNKTGPVTPEEIETLVSRFEQSAKQATSLQ